MQNPFLLTILETLKLKQGQCKLVDLALLIELPESLSPEQELFQKNFFLMNALFQLAESVTESGWLLFFDGVDVKLTALEEQHSFGDSTNTHSISNHKKVNLIADHNLRNYYLDEKHLTLNDQEINQLLTNFWQKYRQQQNHPQHIITAKQRLLLPLDAELSTTMLKQAFRQLAQENHPDRGGNTDKFIEIRQAFELLSRFISK